jgi:hypothetical protein
MDVWSYWSQNTHIVLFTLYWYGLNVHSRISLDAHIVIYICTFLRVHFYYLAVLFCLLCIWTAPTWFVVTSVLVHM